MNAKRSDQTICTVFAFQVLFQVEPLYQGLRGPIAFVLALDLTTKNHLAIFGTTLTIVLFTVLVGGGLITAILEKARIPIGISTFNLKSLLNSFSSRNNSIPLYFKLNSYLGVEEEVGPIMISPNEKNIFINLDRKYFIPFFTRSNPSEVIEQTENSVELQDTHVDTSTIIST